MLIDLTFWDEAKLLILDNVALGGVAAVVAFFGQKRLEQYKARQALLVEHSKARVTHIGRVLRGIANLIAEGHALMDRYFRIAKEEGERVDKLSEAVRSRIDSQLREDFDALLQRCKRIKRLISVNSPWLGKSLGVELTLRVGKVEDWLEAMRRHDMEKLRAAAQRLRESEEDLSVVVERLMLRN